MYGRDLLSISELQPDELDMLLRTAMSMAHMGTSIDRFFPQEFLYLKNGQGLIQRVS